MKILSTSCSSSRLLDCLAIIALLALIPLFTHFTTHKINCTNRTMCFIKTKKPHHIAKRAILRLHSVSHLAKWFGTRFSIFSGIACYVSWLENRQLSEPLHQLDFYNNFAIKFLPRDVLNDCSSIIKLNYS